MPLNRRAGLLLAIVGTPPCFAMLLPCSVRTCGTSTQRQSTWAASCRRSRWTLLRLPRHCTGEAACAGMAWVQSCSRWGRLQLVLPSDLAAEATACGQSKGCRCLPACAQDRPSQVLRAGAADFEAHGCVGHMVSARGLEGRLGLSSSIPQQPCWPPGKYDCVGANRRRCCSPICCKRHLALINQRFVPAGVAAKRACAACATAAYRWHG